MRGFLLTICCLTFFAAIPVEASAFKYTHRVTITGELTDNWSVSDPRSCEAVGSGTLRLTFSMTHSARIRPQISSVGGRPRSRKPGVWVLAVPGGAGFTHMGWKKATSTLTTTDNTVQNPNFEDPGYPCAPDDTKARCGTTTSKRSLVVASGWDRRNLYGDFVPGGGDFSDLICRHGALQTWTRPHPVVGGVNVYSDLLLKMPKASAFRKKRTNVITGSTRKSSTTQVSEGSPQLYSDDVTRSMTVTITKL